MKSYFQPLQLDSTIIEYLESIVQSEKFSSSEEVFDSIGSFLIESITEVEARKICKQIYEDQKGTTTLSSSQTLDSVINLSEIQESTESSVSQTRNSLNQQQIGKKKKKKKVVGAKVSESKTKEIEKKEEDKDQEGFDFDVETANERSLSSHLRHTLSKEVSLKKLTLAYGDVELLDSAELKLTYGHRYGLVGKNGIGKSTLLKSMAFGRISQFPTHLKVFLVEQESLGDERTVLETVMESDKEVILLQKRLNTLERQTDLDHSCVDEINQIIQRLEDLGYDTAEARCSVILKGLGFTESMFVQKTSTLSGGWRMKVNLACALFINPDLLLLDEPTNHLDMAATIWLQFYLKKNLQGTIIIVSHDRFFLNDLVTDIIYFSNKKLAYYQGDFDGFQKNKDEKLKAQQKQAEKDEKKKREIKESIEKYKQQTRSHDPNAKMGMVRSRKKQLEKLGGASIVQGTATNLFDAAWVWGVEGVLAIQEEPEQFYKFTFTQPENLGTYGPILQLEDLSYRYGTQEKFLFEHFSLNITEGNRIAFIGKNGQGKSTLIKLITSEMNPTTGEITKHKNLNIGYFGQHQIHHLPSSLTALEYFLQCFPEVKEDKARGQLSSFGLPSQLATKPINKLSGGQKSRILFSLLSYRKPQILVLDEPSNHLDMRSIEALVTSLQEFKGALILVSHDRFFISQLAERLFLLEDGTISQIDSLDQYVEKISKSIEGLF